MRDWHALVRERLDGCGLAPTQLDEVVAELAAHLEDSYEEQLTQGANEKDAIQNAIDKVTNWRKLARRIRYVKQEEDSMNNRTRNLWLPGLVSGTAAMGSLFILARAGFEPRSYWVSSYGWLQLYIPWLLLLPLSGALGAYLSRRAEGQRLTRLAASLFPSFVMIVLFLLAATVSLIVDRGSHMPAFPNRFAMVVLNWVVLPSAALLIGALPFLGASPLRKLEETTH